MPASSTTYASSSFVQDIHLNESQVFNVNADMDSSSSADDWDIGMLMIGPMVDGTGVNMMVALSNGVTTPFALSPDNNTLFWWLNGQMAWVKYTDPMSGMWDVQYDPTQLLQSEFILAKNGSNVTAVCALDYGECGWLTASGTVEGDAITLLFDTCDQLTGVITSNGSSLVLSNGTQWNQALGMLFPTPIRTVHLIFMVRC